MDIADCYRVLGLTSVANAQEIKSSYRRLARQWHPDVNPDNQHAHDMFIRVTEAYKVLLTVVPVNDAPRQTGRHPGSPAVHRSRSPQPHSPQPRTASQPRTTSQPRPASPPSSPRPSSSQSGAQSKRPQRSTEPPRTSTSSPRPDPAYQVKLRAYEQLQSLLQMKRYPRAVASIEALSQKLPGDPEIKQWQAIIYQRWGRQLIAERKYNQARAYLKKALNTDPNNKSLLVEIERDLRAIKMSV